MVKVEFKPDYGQSGKALGTFCSETNTININLQGIFIDSLERAYHCCVKPPAQYYDPIAFESFLADYTVTVIEHEFIHLTISKLVGSVATTTFDNISEKVTV